MTSLGAKISVPEAYARVIYWGYTGGPRRTVAVIKVRDEVPETLLERVNYVISCELGFGIVAPCLALLRGMA